MVQPERTALEDARSARSLRDAAGADAPIQPSTAR
jgi:hypothetical protein